MLDKTCDRCTEYGYGGIIFLYKLQLRISETSSLELTI